MKNDLPKKIPSSELKLGDVFEFNGLITFRTAVVVGITQHTFTFYRPYLITSDFSYGNEKIIPYIGVETTELPKDKNHIVLLVETGKEFK